MDRAMVWNPQSTVKLLGRVCAGGWSAAVRVSTELPTLPMDG